MKKDKKKPLQIFAMVLKRLVTFSQVYQLGFVMEKFLQ